MSARQRQWLATGLTAAIALFGNGIQAHPHGEQWALANEYPATSLPGEGDELFAKLVADATEGKLSIVSMPDAKLGYKSRDQLQAVAEGKIAMADSFGGALGDTEPILGFASLPFVVADIAQAKALYEAARPAYEAVFARHNQALLYATPWPPSGLWTSHQATTVEKIQGLKIRAYDKTGVEVFARFGARASVVSFADLPAKLKSGEIDAVLSSGDGGAGRKLWDYLVHFDEINYAIPLSFTTVNLDKWKGLDDATRQAVLAAAARTQAHLWEILPRRVFLDYKEMRLHDMAIHTVIRFDPQLLPALRAAGAATVEDWAARAGPEGRALLQKAKGMNERR